MLEEIAHDSVNVTDASNQPMFALEPNFDALVRQKAALLEQWKVLPESERREHKSLRAFEQAQGMVDLKDPALIPSKNASLLLNEVKGRVERQDPLSLLPIESLDFDDAVLELAESLENVNEIRELYRLRKTTTGETPNSGISSEEAAKIKNCFSQGRELYLAGRNGSLMVKPLNFFYALTAYTYGIIILNNPLRYRKDMLPGSHGMSYLPANIKAQFGGDSPRGTFSDLVGAFPTHLIKHGNVAFNIDCSQSVMGLYEKRYDVGLGTLLSMVPEMSEYYKLTTGRQSRCFPLEIVSGNDPRSVTWEFQVGNGEIRPSRSSIDAAFHGFEVVEKFGKYVVTVSAIESAKVKALIYTDLRGNLWFVENPFGTVLLPEVAIHFLITSMFSNIMRYRPDEWGSVLLNEVSSNISLLARHYFSSFQRKFLIVVLRSISRYVPHAL